MARVEPEATRGVDGGAIPQIHAAIRALAAQGKAVVVISSYLPEILSVSDRILIARGGRLVALACRSGTGELLMPCGRCRQVIYEFGGAALMVDTPDGPRDMTWVLPAAFGPEHLPD